MANGFDKVLGCIAASQVGSAMGAAVEGWTWRSIQETHGRLERLLDYEHYDNGWTRPPGTTEDGIERQRVFLRAIRRSQGLPTADDVAAVWRDEVDAEKAAWCMEPFDRRLIRLAKASVAGPDLGRFNPYGQIVSLARSCHPLGLVNAGDPAGAVRSVRDAGRAMFAPTADAIAWAGVVAAGIADAVRPDASTDSVLAAARGAAPEAFHAEIDRALDVATDADDPLGMREAFDEIYSGRGTPYALSFAGEIVSKGLAVFDATEGDPREAILTAVNFGRDTDCLAAVAGGLAGALGGSEGLPIEWPRRVDAATQVNPYTNLKLSLEAQAQIVWDALELEQERTTGRAEVLKRILAA